MITLIFLYKNDPLLLLSPEWFIPFNKFIAFPTGIPGNITMITLIFLYKNDPLLLLSPEWFIPFNKFIAFPTGVPGDITTV